ncbi:DUF4007 family protein [Aquimarina celericrescens]|uniref:DUF4007 family protein n=1 Tax=Aquimarina celericrescens TaxID=1964542 RepID=A0ABW5AW06_9FLAO
MKGIQLIEKEEVESVFKDSFAVPKLGVGKNMVRAIQHWLKAFDILNDDNSFGELAKVLFLDNKFDPYLENEGSLWLLQYHLCKKGYASINQIIFKDYFSDKATLEFSESQILSFLRRQYTSAKKTTDKTLISDYKVFLKTYAPPKKNTKTVEDDFNAPLLGLNLISNTGRRNNSNDVVYRVNRGLQKNISPEIFIYCLLTEYGDSIAISFDEIRRNLGSYLCLSSEGLESIIDKICDRYKEFVYKDDAGVRQLQIKNVGKYYKIKVLEKHYELYR